MSDYIGKICPYCKTPLGPDDDVVICSACEMPHHKDCWVENQGCTTFGCTGTIQGVDGTPAAMPAVFCTHCGRQNESGTVFCIHCGHPMTAPAAPQGTQYTPRPAYQQPVQPAYQQPVQPAYQRPVQPAYQQPVQPAYQQPVQPAYQQPVQPAYQQPVQPAYQQPVQPATVFCIHCGRPNAGGSAFCIHCGRPMVRR